MKMPLTVKFASNTLAPNAAPPRASGMSDGGRQSVSVYAAAAASAPGQRVDEQRHLERLAGGAEHEHPERGVRGVVVHAVAALASGTATPLERYVPSAARAWTVPVRGRVAPPSAAAAALASSVPIVEPAVAPSFAAVPAGA